MKYWYFIIPSAAIILLLLLFLIKIDNMVSGQIIATKQDGTNVICTIKTTSVIAPSSVVLDHQVFQIVNLTYSADQHVFDITLPQANLTTLNSSTINFNCGSISLFSFIFKTLAR